MGAWIARGLALMVTAIVLGVSAASAARADIRVPVFAIADKSFYDLAGTQTAGSLGPGGGLGLDVKLGDSTSLELDATIVRRENLISATYVDFPLLFRYWIGNVLSLGAGGYYSQGIGQVSASSGTQTFAAAGLQSNDFGAVGSVSVVFSLLGVSWLIEGRYQYGLDNFSGVSGISAKFSGAQILFGVNLATFAGDEF